MADAPKSIRISQAVSVDFDPCAVDLITRNAAGKWEIKTRSIDVCVEERPDALIRAVLGTGRAVAITTTD